MPEQAARGATSDTIFAPATGPGGAAIAIIRISGSNAHAAVRTLTGEDLPPWRMLSLRELRGPGQEQLDRAMVVVFPEGGSYTGEAMAEIHCHGGVATVADVTGALSLIAGLRQATPGEFTRRALLSGRMDPTEVEGLGDLIRAETSAQRRQALRVHCGAVSRRVSEWRALLLRARALVEVTIDWVDEEVPESFAPQVDDLIAQALDSIDAELGGAAAAERLRGGLEVAIVGAPNVGKSSLLNAIAGRDAAIVSEVAGTTRDVLEVRVDLGGLPVSFLDTAGLREAADAVEALGVARARRRADAADLRLLLRAPGIAGEDALWREGDIRVWAKGDIASGPGDVVISAPKGHGVGALLELVRERLLPSAEAAGVLVTARQTQGVAAAREHMLQCRALLAGDGALELVAEELRLATGLLDRVIGRIGVEHLLDEIFAGFCLGK